MKSKVLILSLFAFLGLIYNGCESGKSKERDFMLSEQSPATALTIGWYVPVKVVEQLVGKNYTPRVVKDDEMSSIMIYIVKSEQHSLNGKALGMMKAAHLVIPVEKPVGLKVDDADDIESAMACPLNIIDLSNELGNNYADHSYATYRGDIDLDVEYGSEKIIVTAAVKTINGSIELTAMFEGEGEEKEVVSVMLGTKSENHVYFYGEEKFTRRKDGKGNLATDGENMITAMNLSGQPYFLRLDTDISWSFDFVKE